MSSITAHIQTSHPAAFDPAACGTGWRFHTIPDFRWLWLGQAVSQIGEGRNKVRPPVFGL